MVGDINSSLEEVPWVVTIMLTSNLLEPTNGMNLMTLLSPKSQKRILKKHMEKLR